MNLDANIVTGRTATPCPDHPGCILLRCQNMWCTQPVHRRSQPGQPRRFCTTRCRVAYHRGNR